MLRNINTEDFKKQPNWKHKEQYDENAEKEDTENNSHESPGAIITFDCAGDHLDDCQQEN